MAVRGDLCRVLATISWSGACWSPSRPPRSGGAGASAVLVPGQALHPTPARAGPGSAQPWPPRPLAGFGLADGAAGALAATAPATVLTGTVPTTLRGSNVVNLSAVDSGANAIPSACRPGRTRSPGRVTALSRSGQPG
jgi:hypothetical protein